jgi:hypothetical protein
MSVSIIGKETKLNISNVACFNVVATKLGIPGHQVDNNLLSESPGNVWA